MCHQNYKELICNGPDGSHEFSTRTCPQCGTVFCLGCCCDYQYTDDDNDPEWMSCPGCGDAIYFDDPEYQEEDIFIEENELDADAIIIEPLDIPINPDDILILDRDEVPFKDLD